MPEFELDLQHALEVLRQGGTILYPTDTVWGLGCDATQPAAVEKLIRLKAREVGKSMIVLVGSEEDIPRYVKDPDPEVFAYLRAREKPTTVIYEGAQGLAQNLLAPDGSVAVRMVRDPFCRELLKRFGRPLVSTSANVSGDPAPASFGEVVPHIRQGVDYIVSYRQDEEGNASPSTLVRWRHGADPEIIRS